MMMFKVLLSHYVSKTIFLIIGFQFQSTKGGLLDAVGILGNTLQTGGHGHTVPNLLNQVVGGVGTNQGNLVKIPNQMQPQQQVTMQQRPTANNYYTTAQLSNQHVYPTQSYVNNAQRPNVAFQQRPINIQQQNAPNNGYNPQNTGSEGQMVFIPHNTAQNYQQNEYPIAGNQNQLQTQNFGQNGLQNTVGQNNMQQMTNGNLNNQLSNQNVYQNNGRPTSNMAQFGNQNQVYNEQQGLPTGQQFQQPTNNGNYGGSLPPISSVIHPANTGNINHYNNGAQESGHSNDGIKNNGHRNESHKPTHKDEENSKVHSATVHKVFFQAKPLIVDDIAKDDRDINSYYQD